MASPALLYFSTSSHKRHDFRNNFTERKMFVLISLQHLSETFFILRGNERDMMKNLFLSDLIKPELPLQIFEKYTNINFHENPSVGAELFHADRGGRTDMTKVVVTFRNFTNAH